MRKFPEVLDRKLKPRMSENEFKDTRKKMFSFSSDRWIEKNCFCTLPVGKPCIRLAACWFTFLLIAAFSANNSRYRKHQMDLSLTTKIPNNGHFYPKTTSVFLTTYLGNAAVSFGFREKFLHPQNGCSTQKLKRYLLSLPPYFSSFTAFTDKKTPVN